MAYGNLLNISDIENNTLSLLTYLQNDDGCWGELKTQTSRITNTCEVVWCLSFCVNKSIDITRALEVIKGGVLGKNQRSPHTNVLNCDIPRDFGWALIALSSNNILDNKVFLKSLKYLEEHQTDDGGFCARDGDKASLFNSSIVAVGLIFLSEQDLPTSTKKICKSILSRLSNYFSSVIRDNLKNNSEFPYAFYAISLFVKHNLLKFDDIKFCDDLINIAIQTNINVLSMENKSRDLKRNIYRPYRHFSTVWILLGLTTFKSEKNTISQRCCLKIIHLERAGKYIT